MNVYIYAYICIYIISPDYSELDYCVNLFRYVEAVAQPGSYKIGGVQV